MKNAQLIESLDYHLYKLCEEENKKKGIVKGAIGGALIGGGAGHIIGTHNKLADVYQQKGRIISKAPNLETGRKLANDFVKKSTGAVKRSGRIGAVVGAGLGAAGLATAMAKRDKKK